MPRVVLKSDIAASPDLLWQAIKGFSAIGDWNPLVREVESEIGEAAGDPPRNRREEAERLRAERSTWEMHRTRVTTTAFDRAFGDLDKQDLRALEAGFRRFVEEE